MSTTVLSQLQTIEAELASQIERLEAQLASVREKLTGIRTVLPMFAETAASATVPALTKALPSEPDVAEPAISEASASTKTKETKPKKTAQKKAATLKKAAAQKKTPAKTALAQTASAKKTDGRTASWQKYTRLGRNPKTGQTLKIAATTVPGFSDGKGFK
jgi:hypothetical protein